MVINISIFQYFWRIYPKNSEIFSKTFHTSPLNKFTNLSAAVKIEKFK